MVYPFCRSVATSWLRDSDDWVYPSPTRGRFVSCLARSISSLVPGLAVNLRRPYLKAADVLEEQVRRFSCQTVQDAEDVQETA